ncbi:MAG: RidA family protein [Sphingobacteriales bacterium]|nr:RidA family protein [Sphingobacteriales bacterium]
MKTERRTVVKKLLAFTAGITGLGLVAKAAEVRSEKEAGNITNVDNVPLYSGHVKHGNMVYIAGKGAHTPDMARLYPYDIQTHTEHVLKEIERELKLAGSSMDKVLKVTVFIDDIANYKPMNDIYIGRFGNKPPVRTCSAVAKGGIPRESLLAMDCIAYI